MTKRFSILSLLLTFTMYMVAQVTTTPAFIEKGYKGEIVVTFNPNEGNAGMVGATTCYAHTGLITAKSSNGGDWKYATQTWRGGEDKYKMTKVGDNWQLVIPNIYTYYGCPESEEILQMAFVFNDGPNGSKEGKTAENTDIYVDLVDAGLMAKIEIPAEDMLISQGERLKFQCVTNEPADISLQINDKIVSSGTGNILLYFYTFKEGGDYTITFTAQTEKETVTDTRRISVMKPNTVKARPIEDMGIHFSEDQRSVTLVTYAASKTEPAKAVYVVGDFNDWTISADYQMYRDDNYFWLTIDNLTLGEDYAFQYWVVRADGQMKKLSDLYSTELLHPDDKYEPKKVNPDLRDYPEKGDSYVTVIRPGKEAYKWSDATLNFKRPNKNNLVIYEMWVYDWTPVRSLPAVQARLDYLENLGVNAIELMPITEFDGNMNWGYSPNHYFAPDKAYGSEKQIKEFIDECHKRGIAVILDMVFNHGTGLNPMNKLYPYGADLEHNPWYNATPPHGDNVYEDWNHDFPETKNMFRRALQFWLNEYKVDGFRMDLSHGLCGTTFDRLDHIRDYYAAVQSASEGAYFILEHWGNNCDSDRRTLISEGMLCWDNTNNAYSQTAMGWLKDGDGFGNANRDGYVSYCESHDEERNFYKAMTWGNGAVKTDLAMRLNRVPVNMAFNILLDGPHMIWQWNELGFDYSINSAKGGKNDHTNNDNRCNIKEQPEEMEWLQNDLRMAQYQKVAQFIQLRTKLAPHVFEGNPNSANVNGGQTVRYVSWGSGEDAIYVVGNFSIDAPQTHTLPQGTWYNYYTGEKITGTDLLLAPSALAIFTGKKYELPNVPTSYDFDVLDGIFIPSVEGNVNVYPTVTTDVVFLPENSRVEVYNLNGQCVLSAENAAQVSLASQPQGMYIFRIQQGETIGTAKVLRQ